MHKHHSKGLLQKCKMYLDRFIHIIFGIIEVIKVFHLVSAQVGKAMSSNNRNIMQSEDKRLQASTEALQNMKTIKVKIFTKTSQ